MTLLQNFSKKRPKPISFKDVLAEAYRIRYLHPISSSFLIRKFQISMAMANRVIDHIKSHDVNKPVWYPGKPVEQNQESLNDFIKRITTERK
jgi:hypothetical protein